MALSTLVPKTRDIFNPLPHDQSLSRIVLLHRHPPPDPWLPHLLLLTPTLKPEKRVCDSLSSTCLPSDPCPNRPFTKRPIFPTRNCLPSFPRLLKSRGSPGNCPTKRTKSSTLGLSNTPPINETWQSITPSEPSTEPGYPPTTKPGRPYCPKRSATKARSSRAFT